MTDRVRNPSPNNRRVSKGESVGAPLDVPSTATGQVPVPPPATPVDQLVHDQSDSTVPQLPGGFTVVDRETGDVVWDARSGAFVDADELATNPAGSTKMSGNVIIKGGSIASDNFVEGSDGWEIAHDGSAEFNNVAVRGTLEGVDGASILVNGDFAAGIPNVISGDSHTTVSSYSGPGMVGDPCLALTSDGLSTEAIANVGTGDAFNQIPVTPSKAYRIGITGRSMSAPDRRIGLLVTWYDSAGHVTGSVGSCTEHLSSEGFLGTVVGTFTAPANAAYAVLSPYVATLTLNLAAGEQAYFGGASFAPVSESTMGLMRTGDMGEHVEIESGGGNVISFYTGESGETTPGRLRSFVNGDTVGNRWGEMHISSPVVGSNSGRVFVDGVLGVADYIAGVFSHSASHPGFTITAGAGVWQQASVDTIALPGFGGAQSYTCIVLCNGNFAKAGVGATLSVSMELAWDGATYSGVTGSTSAFVGSTTSGATLLAPFCTVASFTGSPSGSGPTVRVLAKRDAIPDANACQLGNPFTVTWFFIPAGS